MMIDIVDAICLIFILLKRPCWARYRL